MSRSSPLAAVFATFAVAAAFTAGPTRAQPVSLSSLDADGDGRLSRAEYLAGFVAASMKYDRNADGRVIRSELPAAARMPGVSRMVDRMFLTIDTSGDGALSRAEFTARAETRFREIDANGDGIADAAEMKTAQQRR